MLVISFQLFETIKYQGKSTQKNIAWKIQVYVILYHFHNFISNTTKVLIACLISPLISKTDPTIHLKSCNQLICGLNIISVSQISSPGKSKYENQLI